MKASKESLITDILIELERGSTYSSTLAVCNAKVPLSRRTFDKYWKLASERHREKLHERQNLIAAQGDAAAVEYLAKGILSKEAALKLLTQTAKGIGRKSGGVAVVPSYAESNAALRIMAELQGWNAPQKGEMKVDFPTQATEDQFEKLREDARKAAATAPRL